MEVIPLYTAPPAAVQPDNRFFMDHGQWHDRVTGQHLWTQDQYDQQRLDWYKQGKEDAMLEQPDSGRDAALMQAAAACMRAKPDRAAVRVIGEVAHYVACRDAVLALRAAQKGEQVPAAK